MAEGEVVFNPRPSRGRTIPSVPRPRPIAEDAPARAQAAPGRPAQGFPWAWYQSGLPPGTLR